MKKNKFIKFNYQAGASAAGGSAGSGSGGLTGYNAGKIAELSNKLRAGMNKVLDSIHDGFQAPVFDKTADSWYAPEAKEYFDNVKTSINSSLVTVRALFGEANKRLNSVMQAWEESVGAAKTFLPALTESGSHTVNSNVLEHDGSGNVGLNDSGMTSVIDGVHSAIESIQSALKNVYADIDASSSFLGGTQATEITNMIKRCSDELETKVFNPLVNGESSLTQTLINFKKKYADSAQAAASSFSGSSFTVTTGSK